MALRAFFLGTIICLLNTVSGDEKIRDKNVGLIDRLTNGMQFAKEFLGSESVALKVAEFVVRAFQGASPSANKTKKPMSFFPSQEPTDLRDKWGDVEGQSSNNLLEEESLPIGGLKQVVKLFGLQPSQVTAVAVNALLFVAQMISTFLSGPQRPIKQQRFENSQSWILNKNSRRLQSVLATASNASLPDLLNQHVTKQFSNNEETACIQLLICKLTPYVSKMQKIVFGGKSENANKNSVGAEIMYWNLPSREEINASNGACEIRYRECDLNTF